MNMANSHFYSEANSSTLPNKERPDLGPPKSHLKNLPGRGGNSCQFPQMKEFSHFHYDLVELGVVKFRLEDHANPDSFGLYAVQVTTQLRSWTVHRGLDHFLLLDLHLHRCIYDRKVSCLPDLNALKSKPENEPVVIFSHYLTRLSELIEVSGSMVNCGTVLNFFELDNRGHRLIVSEDSAINIPAIAAAHCVHRYIAQASDELSLEVGDMVSVIDMPPAEDTNWWRGKKNFEVGLFPCECVEVIGGRVLPQRLASAEDVKPVLRRRGKLISFLRMFFSNRPQRSALKQSGIVKERVFGCDLGEHLLNSGLQVPYVLTSCADFVETYGMIDGVYRLTGVTSSVQKLRFAFDEGTLTDLSQSEYVADLHSVTAVLKMYFRELPNPLLTYHLYGDFAETLHYRDEERLRRIQEVVQRLPPPNYRTAKRLFHHLHKMAQNGHLTSMDTRNLAIVWAPNLMRCKSLDSGGSSVSGMSVLHSVSLQATVTEFIISRADVVFSEEQNLRQDSTSMSGTNKKPRPSSVAISAPSRLLSLSEAQGRLLQLHNKVNGRSNLEVAVAASVTPVYHTVIDFHGERRRTKGANGRMKEKLISASSGTVWKNIFTRHTGSGGLQLRKDKTKSAEDSTESEEDQQLSEIGHLSRRIEGSLPSIRKASDEAGGNAIVATDVRVRLPSGSAFSGDEDEAPYSNCDEQNQGDSTLIRSASHESFFEGDAVVRTPGITFRPAYKVRALDEVVAPLPAATWRRSSAGKSPSPTQSRIPYVSAPVSSSISEKVQPYILQRSPSFGRRSVMCFSSDADPFDTLPNRLHCAGSTDLAKPSSNGSGAAFTLDSNPSQSSELTPLIDSGSGAAHVAALSGGLSAKVDALGGSEALVLPGANATVVEQSATGSSEKLQEFMSQWERSDQLLVANQGLSARLSRSFSMHAPLHQESLSPTAGAAGRMLHDSLASRHEQAWREVHDVDLHAIEEYPCGYDVTAGDIGASNCSLKAQFDSQDCSSASVMEISGSVKRRRRHQTSGLERTTLACELGSEQFLTVPGPSEVSRTAADQPVTSSVDSLVAVCAAGATTDLPAALCVAAAGTLVRVPTMLSDTTALNLLTYSYEDGSSMHEGGNLTSSTVSTKVKSCLDNITTNSLNTDGVVSKSPCLSDACTLGSEQVEEQMALTVNCTQQALQVLPGSAAVEQNSSPQLPREAIVCDEPSPFASSLRCSSAGMSVDREVRDGMPCTSAAADDADGVSRALAPVSYETGTARRETVMTFALPQTDALRLPDGGKSSALEDHACSTLSTQDVAWLATGESPRAKCLAAAQTLRADSLVDNNGVCLPEVFDLPLHEGRSSTDVQSAADRYGSSSTLGSPKQCAFQWVMTPSLELPAVVKVAAVTGTVEPTGSCGEHGPSDDRVADAAAVSAGATVGCNNPMDEPCSGHGCPNSEIQCQREGASTLRSSLYAAVKLERPKLAAAGGQCAPPPVRFSGVMSPDITDAFKAFSGT